MKTFKEFTQQDEAMTLATRMKMKQAFRKNKAKILRGRQKAAKKIASMDQLQGRAQKQARNILLKKILQGKDKSELSFAARAAIEKKLEKKKNAIKRIAKKLLPSVKKADRDKLKKNSSKEGEAI